MNNMERRVILMMYELCFLTLIILMNYDFLMTHFLVNNDIFNDLYFYDE